GGGGAGGGGGGWAGGPRRSWAGWTRPSTSWPRTSASARNASGWPASPRRSRPWCPRRPPGCGPTTLAPSCCWPRPSRRERCACSGRAGGTWRWWSLISSTAGGRAVTAAPEGGQRPGGDEEEGVRARLLLDEPVHLVTQAGAPAQPRTAGSPLAGYAEHRWIAGCERCRAHLLWQCELAGFTPLVAFTSDDVLVAQALAAAGLGVALLPDLALRAARHPRVRTAPLP